MDFDGAMRQAIEASHAAQGVSSPNPPVGAVIVAPDGTVVGVGATAPPGGPHAEVVALRAAGESARGATAVVTLEPCNHTGRTGPCAQALLDAGIAEVAFAVADPNPAAAGGARTPPRRGR
jgi:diaminohydroxyphosphoribosylaminopyrimidine deaminase/5-amino-6-(5-phosphoribosylamino)uracil reductase